MTDVNTVNQQKQQYLHNKKNKGGTYRYILDGNITKPSDGTKTGLHGLNSV